MKRRGKEGRKMIGEEKGKGNEEMEMKVYKKDIKKEENVDYEKER